MNVWILDQKLFNDLSKHYSIEIMKPMISVMTLHLNNSVVGLCKYEQEKKFIAMKDD